MGKAENGMEQRKTMRNKIRGGNKHCYHERLKTNTNIPTLSIDVRVLTLVYSDGRFFVYKEGITIFDEVWDLACEQNKKRLSVQHYCRKEQNIKKNRAKE